MSWTKSLSLSLANEFLNLYGVTFEDKNIEGVYTAIMPDGTPIRRVILKECFKAALHELITAGAEAE